MAKHEWSSSLLLAGPAHSVQLHTGERDFAVSREGEGGEAEAVATQARACDYRDSPRRQLAQGEEATATPRASPAHAGDGGGIRRPRVGGKGMARRETDGREVVQLSGRGAGNKGEVN